MSNQENKNERNVDTQLLNSLEEALDKVAYSKSRHPLRVETRKQLEELKLNIRHKRVSPDEASSELSVLLRKVDILRQIEDLESKLTEKPPYPEDAHTNPVSREAWEMNDESWGTQTQYIEDQIKKLENNLKPGILDKLKRFLGGSN